MIKVGGISRNNGIKFEGDRYTVSFEEVKNKTEISVGKKVASDSGKLMKFIRKVPFVRGIVSVICKNTMLLGLVVVDIIINLIPVGESSSTITISDNAARSLMILSLVTSMVSVAVLVYLARKAFANIKRTCQYHGAEHKVIETNYMNKEINLENCRNAPRVSDNCGTMLVSLMLFVWILLAVVQTVFAFEFWGSIELMLMVGIAYEFFLMNRTTVVLLPAFKLGHFLQKHFFTKEPTDHQLAQAMLAFSILEALETNEITLEEVKEVLEEANLNC